ncbi:MAG: HD domain-containing phosphohydrolase [Aliarcobacter sp.]|nr:HD domain-containing phosphohydrolase [Aliarcobacter sp.]
MDKKKQMQFNLNNFLLATSIALDFVSKDRYKISLGHAKRVAYIALNIGIKMDLTSEELSDLCSYSLLSSIALNQSDNDKDFCEISEECVKEFPFLTQKENVLKYQKEKIDGSGIFGVKEDEIPLFSQIIFLAKTLDIMYDFGKENIKNRIDAIEFIKDKLDMYFSRQIIEKFFECVTEVSFWQDMLNEQDTLIFIYSSLHDFTKALDFEEILKITTIFHKIENPQSKLIDLSEIMCDFYEFEHKDKQTFLIASSLCNIGKLTLSKDLLEKENELDIYEVEKIKTYPYYTKKILQNIIGFSDITSWASKVQERLDGSGYIMSLTGKDLTFKDRLIQSLNAYNALRQNRVYRESFSHEEAIEILKFEASENRFDIAIIEDIDRILKES